MTLGHRRNGGRRLHQRRAGAPQPAHAHFELAILEPFFLDGVARATRLVQLVEIEGEQVAFVRAPVLDGKGAGNVIGDVDHERADRGALPVAKPRFAGSWLEIGVVDRRIEVDHAPRLGLLHQLRYRRHRPAHPRAVALRFGNEVRIGARHHRFPDIVGKTAFDRSRQLFPAFVEPRVILGHRSPGLGVETRQKGERPLDLLRLPRGGRSRKGAAFGDQIVEDYDPLPVLGIGIPATDGRNVEPRCQLPVEMRLQLIEELQEIELAQVLVEPALHA